jgi:hypothetical protein
LNIYKKNNINEIIDIINNDIFKNKCRINEKAFTRERKLKCKDLVLYELNKRGLSTKMEILNFNNINYVENVSAPALFKQREKLNPEAFTYLIQESLKNFYTNYKKEVKTYKGYILEAVDGSDFEVPNTYKAREKYHAKQKQQCARVTVSTCYDILNKYTLDTIVEKYDYSETEMLKQHMETIEKEKIIDKYKPIVIADRNYRNLSFFYHAIEKNQKFLIRIGAKVYKEETSKMKTADENIEIKYSRDRISYYKNSDPNLYEYLKKGNTIKIRCIMIVLETGEIEYLLTNLEEDIFSTNDINELYNLRWQTELNYRHLKNDIKIECITSSKEILIKQDVYSQVLVSNILQAYINDGDELVSNLEYKNKMKVNNNMAVGIFKNSFIYIFLEENIDKRSELMEKLQEAINKFIVPVKPGRKNPRNNNPKNRYHINQRKTF